jgi:ABC-type anion transport system duplicated permease subunit
MVSFSRAYMIITASELFTMGKRVHKQFINGEGIFTENR